MDEVQANLYLLNDPTAVPILLAATKAKVDYLATGNRKHFLDDPKVSERSGLTIGTRVTYLPGYVTTYNFKEMQSS